MSSSRGISLLGVCAIAFLASVPSTAQSGSPGNVTMIAGNGQVVQVNFLSTVPMTIQVTDGTGTPVSGVPVMWTITQGADTASLNQPSMQTDTNGMATSNFFATFIQPGLSFVQMTITASTPVGTVTFYQTAVPVVGGQISFVSYLTAPSSQITGVAGSTLRGAVKVVVAPAAGIYNEQGIPNIGIRMVVAGSEQDLSPPSAPAMCNAPAATALTGSDGSATCDLVLGNTPGVYQLEALVGNYGPAAGLNGNPSAFTLQITSAPSCSFSLGSASQSLTAAAGTGTVSVNTTAGCNWTAVSNANYVTITSGASGSGAGTVGYSVTANTGASRSATLSIAGQTFTINQAAVTTDPAGLTITSNNMPGATVGASYSSLLSAAGGTPPYTWQVTAGSPPQGLTLSSTGTISGTPAQSGAATFTATVSDTAGATQSQTYTLSVAEAGAGISITNASFPNGAVGTPYSQQLSYSSTIQCGGPFGAPAVFSIAGGSIPGLSIQNTGNGYSLAGTPTMAGAYNITLKVTDACGNSATASYTITIGGSNTATTLMASVQSLTFNVQGAGAVAAQPVSVTSTGSSLNYTVAANSNGVTPNWLFVDQTSGSTPASFNVSVANYQNLAAGPYQGTITITSGNQIISIPVTLNVGAAPAQMLLLTPNSLTFTQTPGTSASQNLAVTSTTSIPFTLTTQIISGNTQWLSVSPASGVTGESVTVTVSSGILQPGTYLGTITANGAGVTQVAQVKLVVVPTTISVDVTSAAFTYQPGVAPPAAQVVNLITNGASIPVTVTTATAAGGNWLFATQATNQSITAITISVNPLGLGPGGYNGTVTITPTVANIQPIQIPVALTVTAGPNPLITGVVNAASSKPGPVSPGEFITIYGLNMAGSTPQNLTLDSNNMVETSLGGTQVTFDGIAAPLVYVSATQINAIVPYEVYGRTTTQLIVTYNNTPSSAVTLGVVDAAPGIFLAPAPNPNSEAAALNEDFTVNSATNGARAGSIITLYTTGEGETNPAGVTGSITSTTLAHPLEPVTAAIGGFPATVLYAGSAPGLAEGVMQVNLVLPVGIPTGVPVPVTISVGSIPSNQATIVVSP